MKNMWKEIIHVTRDHSTLYMRVPMAWAEEEGVEAGSYLIARRGPGGLLVVNTWEQEFSHGKKTGDGRGGKDR